MNSMVATNIDIKKIEEEIIEGQLIPQQLAEKKLLLSGWYSRYSEEHEDLLALRPKEWRLIRSVVKTNKEADREYEASEHGIDLMRLKHTLDRIDKLISAINTMIYVKDRETKNQW